MPFTLAHPGYSIWLKNKWLKKLSYTGLIFGSITPDFDILFRFTNIRFHLLLFNAISIFLILIPLTLLLSIFFHLFIRNILIDNLPEEIASRFVKFKSFNFIKYLKQNFGLFIFSILLSICFHFFLDIISHWDAFQVKMFMNVIIYPSKFLMPFYFYFGWYFPQILATFMGLYLSYIFMINNDIKLEAIVSSVKDWELRIKLFWLFFFFVGLLFTAFKFLVFSYEGNGFMWHSAIIYYTSGLIFSFFTTPILFNQISKFFKH